MPSVTIGNLTFVYDSSSGISEEVHIDADVNRLTAQELINSARQAEASDIGMAFDPIALASGKDALSESTSTGITVQLLGEWRLYTLKNSGSFAIGDGNIIKPDGTTPFVNNSSVTYIQNLSAAATISQVIGGGAGEGASAADVWNYPGTRSLSSTGNSAIANAISAILASSFASLSSAITSSTSAIQASIATGITTILGAIALKASEASVEAIAVSLARLGKLRGLIPGVSIKAARPTSTTNPGYMRSSDGEINLRIKLNTDGSEEVEPEP